MRQEKNRWYQYCEGKKASRTFFGHFHFVLDVVGEHLDLMCNLQISCRRHQSLFFRECIQLLKRVLDVRPSH